MIDSPQRLYDAFTMEGNISEDKKIRALIPEFLRLFYTKGWVSGTGGGICAAFDESHVLMAPSGVHKERVLPEDLFVIHKETGNVVQSPENQLLCLSECAPIFCEIMKQRGAGAVMHSHALSAVLAADTVPENDGFLIESLEMLKGIANENNQSHHLVPVINNTMREKELVERVQSCLSPTKFARAYCLLVRDHGAYIWGRDIWEAKRHIEVYHFLFEAVLARQQWKQGRK